MGSELGFGRWPVGVVFKWVGMTKGLANLSSANPALWAMPGLNWRPLPCQGSALPLRYVRMLASGPLRSFRTLSFLLGDEKVL